MAEALPETVAVIGEKLFLLVKGAEPVSGPVTVSFQWKTDGPEIVTLDFWTENLVAEAADTAANPGAVAQIPWTVNLNGIFTMPKRPPSSIIFFSISGAAASGKPVRLDAANRLRIPGFSVTRNSRLRSIMIHEFVKADPAGNFDFDEAPLQAVLDGLDVAQRKLLATHDPGPDGNRLVVFITLQKENTLRMHADTCQDFAQSIKPNATFSIFHCQGAGKEVSLVCHTRHFVFNMINPTTLGLATSPNNGQPPDKWLSRGNPKPPMFKIGAFAKANDPGTPNGTDGVLWNRVFTPEGRNIMGGNTMHGMINTIGCWMLFRNFNWPKTFRGKPVEDEFDRIYTREFRQATDRFKKAITSLVAVGYDGDPKEMGNKFRFFDRNFAYTWLFRELMGVSYFSRKRLGDRAANDRNTHGLVHQTDFDAGFCERFIEANGDGDTPKFIYHDLDDRLAEEPSFKIGNSLWVENALGFKAAKGFVSDVDRNLKPAEVADLTWGDLYIYRADDLPAAKIQRAFLAKV